MADALGVRVAVVDYGMGNLFSVKRACERAGMRALLTASAQEIRDADAVILPGVGAFPDAMATLRRLDLVDVLQHTVRSGKPLMGICLGMQLLMTESYEFGRHLGLGVIDGEVVRFQEPRDGPTVLKVPQVGWNRIWKRAGASWDRSFLDENQEGEWMYFVHSFYVKPTDERVVLATSRYGDTEFCAVLQQDRLFACQFHPERSGRAGLRVYQRFAAQVQRTAMEVERV